MLLKRWQKLTHWCNKQNHYIFFFLKSPILLQNIQCLQLKIWNKASQVSDSNTSPPAPENIICKRPSIHGIRKGAFQPMLMGCPHSGIDVVNSINFRKKAIASHSFCQSQLRATGYYFRDYEAGIPATDHLKAYDNSFEICNFGLGLLLLKIMLCVLMFLSTEPPYQSYCYHYNIFIHVFNQTCIVFRIIYHKDLDTTNSAYRQRLRAYQELVEIINRWVEPAASNNKRVSW